MKKVLLLAYAVSPTKGSEYSVSWNFIVNMSKDIELVVLYGTSGNHLGDTEELKDYINKNPIPNVRFIPVNVSNRTDKLNYLNKKGYLGYSFYFAFNSWHKQVFEKAKELLKNENFDIVHYLTPIGYREPGFLWKLGLPYVWGPVGGTYSVPVKLMKALSFSGKLKLGFRKIINNLQLNYKNSLHCAIQETDVLIASTTYDQYVLSKKFIKKIYYLPENCITQKFDNYSNNYFSSVLNIIWIGSIDYRKALIILLEALRKIDDLTNFHLNVVGDGLLKSDMMQFASKYGLNDKITWHGSVAREQVMQLLSESHLNIITSLTEANTTVIWEAMSFNVPTLSLDHCGMHDTICEQCGIKIPITEYEDIIQNIATQLMFYEKNREALKKKSEGVDICSQKYMWKNRIEFWKSIYDEAIKIHKDKNE